MRPFTERKLSERTAAEGEGGMEGRRNGGREDSELGRGRQREREGGGLSSLAHSKRWKLRRRRREK